MSLHPLRVGGVPEHFNLPWLLAIESGAFEAVGADVSWIDFPGGTGALVDALEDDSLDVATVLTEGMVTAIAAGNPTFIHSTWVQSPLMWGIHVADDSPFDTVESLADERFAISRPGSGSELMAYVLADEQGWKLDGTRFVTVGGLEGALESLPMGTSEIFLWEKFMTQPHVDRGVFRRVGEIPTPWPSFVTASRRDTLDGEGGDILDQVCLVAMNTAAELHASDEAAELISDRYGLEYEQATEWLTTVEWAQPAAPDEDMLGSVIERMRSLGRIKGKLPTADLLA